MSDGPLGTNRLADTGEKVVFGRFRIRQVPDEQVLLERINGVRYVLGQTEPEGRARVDLCGVSEQGAAGHICKAGDIDD
jgi:hypothetical protein